MFKKINDWTSTQLEDFNEYGGFLTLLVDIGIELFLLLFIPICGIIWALTWPFTKIFK